MSGNMDANAAINFMMSKYQEELLRQYTMGTTAKLMSNPFALKNLLPTSTSSFNTGSKMTPPKTNVPLSSGSLNPSGSALTVTPTSSKNINKNPITSKSNTQQTLTKPLTLTKPSMLMKDTGKTLGKSLEKPTTSTEKLRFSKETQKSYYVDQPKEFQNNISIFKDRPGISITPINQPPVTSGKTLQQKLAERQKQNPANQKPVIKNPTNFPTPYKSSQPYQNIQKQIPSSLTITKTQTQPSSSLMGIHTGDSGISISPAFAKPTDISKVMNFRKPQPPIQKMQVGGRKLGSEITVTPNFNKPSVDSKVDFPPNIPLSLSVVKKDSKSEPKPQNEAVEIITIE